MKTQHNGTEIEYDESRNEWLFELRGRSRAAESLTKAKEFIDKPVAEKDEKPFQRTPAYFWDWNGSPKECEITGVAESPSYSSRTEHLWIVCEKKRAKQPAEKCFHRNEASAVIVKEWLEIESERARLFNKSSELKRKMTQVSFK
jgi:hypothetical protein